MALTTSFFKRKEFAAIDDADLCDKILIETLPSIFVYVNDILTTIHLSVM